VSPLDDVNGVPPQSVCTHLVVGELLYHREAAFEGDGALGWSPANDACVWSKPTRRFGKKTLSGRMAAAQGHSWR
jgi:hypothetical protein